jgi:hypothetical protein
LLALTKWSSLQKSVSKFMLKKFYEIDSQCNVQSYFQITLSVFTQEIQA